MAIEYFKVARGLTTGNITLDAASGNISASYIVGNGAGITSISAAAITGTISNVSTAVTVTASAQPNITSVGTLTSVSATGNISGNYFIGNGSQLTGLPEQYSNANVAAYLPTYTGNLASLTGAVTTTANITGNYFIGNGSQLMSITGANVTGTVASATTAGTVTTAAQPNITSVGTLSTVSVTGNITSGNINAAGVVEGNSMTIANGASIGGVLTMNNQRIVNLATPTASTDAATKQYVDEVAQGLKAAPAAEAATTVNLSATYNNGTAGVGATLTATANGAFPAVDGVTVSSTTPGQNGILVKNQTNPAQNGRYNLTQIGNSSTPWILTRCAVCDQANEIPGSYVFVKAGSTQASTGWVAYVANPATFVVGTDSIIYFQFSGAGTYTAGTGLDLNGTAFSIANTAVSAGAYGSGDRVASFTVNQQGQITSAANTVITANAANLSGTVLKSTVVTSSLTSVGTLGTLAVTGNITGGNLITAGLVSLSSIVKTGINGAGNIGSSTSTFNTVFAKATSAQYADLAERYQADADYPVGTVLVFGGSHEVTASSITHDSAVVGVVSENPSYLMNAGLQTANSTSIALLGRVKCRVTGTIYPGDLLVTSDIIGTACRLDPAKYLPGCVIGKAIEHYNSIEPGIIEIAVGIK